MKLQGLSIALVVLVLAVFAVPILGWGLMALTGVPIAEAAGGWCW